MITADMTIPCRKAFERNRHRSDDHYRYTSNLSRLKEPLDRFPSNAAGGDQ